MQVFVSLVTVVFHTVVLYIFLVLGFSLLGRRQVSELSIIELLIVMAIGSSVETALIGGDTSLPAGLVSAGTLMLSNKGLSFLLKRWGWLQKAVVGQPVILVYKGQILEKQLRSSGLTQDNLMEGLRERGFDHLDQVRLAVLELDGSISVLPKK